GEVPARVVITDQSRGLIDLAQRYFRVPEAEYRALDVRDAFPFADGSFDLIVANMIFNEVTGPVLRRALDECRRVLGPAGRLLATVTHPDFVDSLACRGQLKPYRGGVFTMPGADGLRLPVVRRSTAQYLAALKDAGFRCSSEEVFATAQILNAKPGL